MWTLGCRLMMAAILMMMMVVAVLVVMVVLVVASNQLNVCFSARSDQYHRLSIHRTRVRARRRSRAIGSVGNVQGDACRRHEGGEHARR